MFCFFSFFCWLFCFICILSFFCILTGDGVKHVGSDFLCLLVHTVNAFLQTLGSLLGGMRDVRIFQPSRVGRGWAWPEGGNPIDFSARQISDGLQDSCHASLVISLSGVINMKTIVDIPNGSPVYELTTTDPDTGIVTSEETVRTFVNEVTSLIDDIHESYPRVKELHVYPAMPASLAVGFGTALRFNLISKYVVHEKADGTFGEALCIGRFDG